MSNVPADLKYTDEHEWIRTEADGTLTVGITDHAQSTLGDIVFLELPKVGDTLKTGQECAVVESVKAASDVYSPLAGVVTGGNAELASAPELINQDPYGKGWMVRLKPADPSAIGALLDAAAYQASLAASGG